MFSFETCNAESKFYCRVHIYSASIHVMLYERCGCCFSELVERLQAELVGMLPRQKSIIQTLNKKCPRGWTYVPVNSGSAHHNTVLTDIFQGELVSEVNIANCFTVVHCLCMFSSYSTQLTDLMVSVMCR